MTDRKLGRQPYRHDPRTLRLENYIDPKALPAPPAAFKWDPDVRDGWPMYLNDQLGDCTCAEVGHHVELWTAAGSTEVRVRDDDVLKLYEQVSGYDPKTGANDNGAVILDVMRAWRNTGIAGHKIGAFVEVDPTSRAHVEDGCYLFGGLSLGINMPVTAQNDGHNWKVHHWAGGDAEPGSWGGHCVYMVDYDRRGVTVVSWGDLYRMTWGFWNKYVDEAWAAISVDFLNGSQQTPQGFSLLQLQADLAQLGHPQ